MSTATQAQEISKSIHDNLALNNDIDIVNIPATIKHISSNSQFSLSFVILLSGSTIICTLGLLLSSAPVIIGGMIMSPLMWPLMKTAVGLSYEKRTFVQQALFLLIFSIVISLISSYLITLLSPIKVISSEITARTTPTLLDLIISLVAGVIAALGITHKKISDTLAGVTVATSLIPPLCVGGIGFALGNNKVASGGLLLFFANIVAIIFAAMVVFIILGVRKKHFSTFGIRGFLVSFAMLLITAVPLYFLLQGYSFKTSAHRHATNIIQNEMATISPAIYVSNLKTDVENPDFVRIQVTLLMPKELSLNIEHKQNLVAKLEETLQKKIELDLLIQQLVSLESDQDQLTSKLRNQVSTFISSNLKAIDDTISIDALLIHEVDSRLTVDLTLIADPSTNLTRNDREFLESQLTHSIGKPVTLAIKVVPLLTLPAAPDLEKESIKAHISGFLAAISNEIEVSSVTIVKKPDEELEEMVESYQVELQLLAPNTARISSAVIDNLTNELETVFAKQFNLNVTVITKRQFGSR